jgi:hypothetical protein
MFWATVFVQNDNLYLLGNHKLYGDIVISKSSDGGSSWTFPKDENTGRLKTDGQYHCAPVPIIVHNGRVWRAMEKMGRNNVWGTFQAGVMSAPVDSDLLKSENWRYTNFLPTPEGSTIHHWLEGNTVLNPEGQIVNILRSGCTGAVEKAVVLNVSSDGQTISIDPEKSTIDMPGASGKKFTIRFDPVSKLYWAVVNPMLPEHNYPANPGEIRNAMAVISSPDLKNWDMQAVVLYHPDVKKHAFQYPDWVFDGDDMIVLSRTAYDDPFNGANSFHNANYLTFHRIENFRDLDSAVTEKTMKPWKDKVFHQEQPNTAETIQSKVGKVPPISVKASPFGLSDVRLLDGPFKDAMDRNAAYLLLLEPDRFLAWFRREAGLEPRGKVYGGWESQGVAGQMLGHYLSACAIMYAASGDSRFKERVDYIVEEWALCQDKNGKGYLAAFPNGKQAFEEVNRGQVRSQGFDLNGLWVPWYVLHKEMAGLRDAFFYCDNKTALKVWIALADWSFRITENLTDEQFQRMLDCEHGGMKEVCVDLYSIVGDKKYLALAKRFTHKKVMDPLSQHKDILPGFHANTQIPKLVGAAREYELTGDKYCKTIAEFSWDTIVRHHTYVNGGNSAGEHFGPEDKLNDRLHETTETCNTYNMLKLTDHLFTWKPSAQLGDFYERALLNHILTHQHPVTGMLMYKGFLDKPARKGFSTPFDSFFCCVGTGMENHAKYGGAIYYHNENTLYVNLFIASQLEWRQKGLTIRQETNWPYSDTVRLNFSGKKTSETAVLIRKPYWADAVSVSVNHVIQDSKPDQDGFIRIKRDFQEGDVVELKAPMTLRTESMPDNPNRIAFFYGPTLLCADLNGDKTVPILVGSPAAIPSAFQRIENKPLEFVSQEGGKVLSANGWKEIKVRLAPLFEVADQWYSVYMDVYSEARWQKEQKK